MSRFLMILVLLFSVNAIALGNSNDNQTSIKAQTTVATSTSSAKVLNANPDRKYLLIINVGATAVTIYFGGANVSSAGVVIGAGGNYEPSKVPTDVIWAKAASGTPSLNIIEGN